MTPAPMIHLRRMQEPNGCFPSKVCGSTMATTDENGFTTAMVLRALKDQPNAYTADRLRANALDFVERCRSPQRPSAFCFWPEDKCPDWAPKIPPDIDDTAIMTIELMRHGRLSRHEGLRTICSVLIPNRMVVREEQLHPPWVLPGAFTTWIGPGDKPNLVDCCVNANAAALMAMVGATHLPGYGEAVQTIINGIAWAGADPVRQQTLTPFYPSIHELEDAVIHAVDCGVIPLRAAMDQLRKITKDNDTKISPGCCRNAYGSIVWRCRGLEQARRLSKKRWG